MTRASDHLTEKFDFLGPYSQCNICILREMFIVEAITYIFKYQNLTSIEKNPHASSLLKNICVCIFEITTIVCNERQAKFRVAMKRDVDLAVICESGNRQSSLKNFLIIL
jgi:hypothetical protein